jgi:hypothetical protein
VEDACIQRDAGALGQVLGGSGQEEPQVRDSIPLVVVLKLAQQAVAATVENPSDVPLGVIVIQHVLTCSNGEGAEGAGTTLLAQEVLPVRGNLGVLQLGDGHSRHLSARVRQGSLSHSCLPQKSLSR